MRKVTIVIKLDNNILVKKFEYTSCMQYKEYACEQVYDYMMPGMYCEVIIGTFKLTFSHLECEDDTNCYDDIHNIYDAIKDKLNNVLYRVQKYLPEV